MLVFLVERAHTWPWHDLPHVKGKVTEEKSNAFRSPMISATKACVRTPGLPFGKTLYRVQGFNAVRINKAIV